MKVLADVQPMCRTRMMPRTMTVMRFSSDSALMHALRAPNCIPDFLEQVSIPARLRYTPKPAPASKVKPGLGTETPFRASHASFLRKWDAGADDY